MPQNVFTEGAICPSCAQGVLFDMEEDAPFDDKRLECDVCGELVNVK